MEVLTVLISLLTPRYIQVIQNRAKGLILTYLFRYHLKRQQKVRFFARKCFILQGSLGPVAAFGNKPSRDYRLSSLVLLKSLLCSAFTKVYKKNHSGEFEHRTRVLLLASHNDITLRYFSDNANGADVARR